MCDECCVDSAGSLRSPQTDTLVSTAFKHWERHGTGYTCVLVSGGDVHPPSATNVRQGTLPFIGKTRRGGGAAQVMTCDTTSLTEDMPVRDAVEKFVTSGTSGFPVMDKEGGTELRGILSLADILWHEAMEDIIEEEKVCESSERE